MTMTRLVPGLVLIAVAAVATAVAGERGPGGGEPAPIEAAQRHRGVSWVAGRQVEGHDLDVLAERHVNWIVQTPFGWQRGLDAPAIALATAGGVLWGETDEGLAVTTDLARQRGIRTLLKPHLWIRGGGWCGDIRMADDAAWAEWFDSYRTFILHYARFAEAHGIDALCIGTELPTTVGFEDDWRRIIGEVRAVYHGKLTYAANWYHEFEKVPFWDALDYIGIQGYFPLTDDDDAATSVDDLVAGWRRPKADIQRLQRRVGRPVLFTELGYRSVPYAARRPWEWPRRGEAVEPDVELQARCYEAFYRTFWHEPWFAGVYWWKWFPVHDRAGGRADLGFTPQRKPAEAVMASWYRPAF